MDHLAKALDFYRTPIGVCCTRPEWLIMVLLESDKNVSRPLDHRDWADDSCRSSRVKRVSTRPLGNQA